MLKVLRAIAVAIAMAVTFTTKLFWESGKWVARSVRDSLRPPFGAHAEVEDAFDTIATKAQSAAAAVLVPALESVVTAKPMPAPIPLDPILEKGRIAERFAHAMLTLNDEPSTEGLDEASVAWLNSLNASELMQIDRHGAHHVGSHMAGLRQIEGLPLTPNPAEYRSALCAAAQITPEMRANIREHDETLKRVIEEMLAEEPERFAPAM